ncbi:MAG: YqgE/AlgH family protein [Alphaproteobacteria bacterium]|nr:YqgE/AlgH family protein [Alphaproteobacteria bacterium]MCY4318516.1 YqgE/AlgH family protein [Alphaproteobacteria bacterium]
MTQDLSGNGWLTGQLLIAMPSMGDPRFERTVIYMCAHGDEGAMGLVINKSLESLSFTDLMEQLGVENNETEMSILSGGPVETGRGFVLHSADYDREGSLAVSDNIRLTATIDVLKAIAVGHGPQKCLLALGYAGWAPGQIEGEIQRNDWLTAPADDAILFDNALESKWGRAIGKLGVDASMLSSFAGRA